MQWLTALALAGSCGAAVAQETPQNERPKIPRTQGEAFAAVPGDCVRGETRLLIAFACGDHNWFFTKPEAAAHPGFAKLPDMVFAKPEGWGVPRLYREPDTLQPPVRLPHAKSGFSYCHTPDQDACRAWVRSLPQTLRD